MKKTISILILLFSESLLANQAPISNIFKCIDKGCSLSCMNSKNNWSAISNKAEKVTVTHYTSGNVECFLHYNDKTKGNETILISQFRLQCKLSGTN